MEHRQQIRLVEAMLFASADPLEESVLAARLPQGADVAKLLEELRRQYADRGVHLVRVGKGWALRTAPDLAPHLRTETQIRRKLTRAALETLAIIAYHQPITRAEIEEIRGVSLSRGTLDILLEAGWIKPRGRRRVPGRPVTWGTTDAFLDHFGLESIDDLPGLEELKAAGLLVRDAGIGSLLERRETENGEQDAEPEAGSTDRSPISASENEAEEEEASSNSQGAAAGGFYRERKADT